MSTLSGLIHQIKDRLKGQIPAVLRLTGLSLLTKAQTEQVLRPSELSRAVKKDVSLPAVNDVADPQKVLFAPKVVATEPDFVWLYRNTTKQANVRRSGLVQIGNKIIDTDFGNISVAGDLLTPDRRTPVTHSLIVAPWSHYWPGYFDFLIFVIAKVARIQRTVGEATLAEAIITYPLIQSSFEREWYELLGVKPAQLVDSRTHSFSFDECLIGNNSSWFYPSADDMLALQTTVTTYLQSTADEPANRRLYISRNARRRVLNEPELVAMLMRHGFEIIEDKPRSVTEQLRLYRSASFIMGPHGASFGNLIACRPGTQFLELFPPNYMPEYFRYMANILGLRYNAYCLGTPTSDRDNHANVEADLNVAVDELERGLMRLLDQPTP